MQVVTLTTSELLRMLTSRLGAGQGGAAVGWSVLHIDSRLPAAPGRLTKPPPLAGSYVYDVQKDNYNATLF